MREQWEEHWKDYYKILGVDRKADPKAIKKAYRKLATQYHPDLNPDNQEAENLFKEINEAYSILGDKEKKKRYDKAYDEMKVNGNYSNQNQNNSSQNQNSSKDEEEAQTKSYEETEKAYTDEEKRYAKKIALQEIIREELEKVDVILTAINELAFNGISYDIEKREYYNAVKELVNTGYEFINGLSELAKEAYKYDLLNEEEIIYDTIENLNNEIKNIPLTPNGVRKKIIDGEYKQNISSLLITEIANANICLDKLKSILLCTFKGEITHLDYEPILSNILFECKNTVSRLKNILKLAEKIKLDNVNSGIDVLLKLELKINIMPEDYDKAVSMGKSEGIKEEIYAIIKEWTDFESKIERMEAILNKYPNSSIFYTVCISCFNAIKKYCDTMQIILDKSNNKDLKSEISYKKTKDTSDKAVSLYENAENLHAIASKIYNNKSELKVDQDSVFYLLKSAVATWDKCKAFDLMLEANTLIAKLDYTFNPDGELINASNKLKECIKNGNDFLKTYKKLLDEYKKREEDRLRTNASNELAAINKEIKIRILKMAASILICSKTLPFPIDLLLDGHQNTLEEYIAGGCFALIAMIFSTTSIKEATKLGELNNKRFELKKILQP